jgi:hypothetical protein
MPNYQFSINDQGIMIATLIPYPAHPRQFILEFCPMGHAQTPFALGTVSGSQDGIGFSGSDRICSICHIRYVKNLTYG